MPPGRAWRPCRPGTVATCGGSLVRRLHFVSGMLPPAILNQLPGVKPSGRGNFNEDDQKVTFPRGGGWIPPGQPSPTPAPVQPDGRLVPLGPPPQPLRPAPADPDVGCLINTLGLGLHLGTPRINTFSGEAMPSKTEVSFEQWYHEVQCVRPLSRVSGQGGHSSVSQRGSGRYGLVHGPYCQCQGNSSKIMVNFGMVASFDVLMQNFYKVTQCNHEKVPSWRTLSTKFG